MFCLDEQERRSNSPGHSPLFLSPVVHLSAPRGPLIARVSEESQHGAIDGRPSSSASRLKGLWPRLNPTLLTLKTLLLKVLAPRLPLSMPGPSPCALLPRPAPPCPHRPSQFRPAFLKKAAPVSQPSSSSDAAHEAADGSPQRPGPVKVPPLPLWAHSSFFALRTPIFSPICFQFIVLFPSLWLSCRLLGLRFATRPP